MNHSKAFKPSNRIKKSIKNNTVWITAAGGNGKGDDVNQLNYPVEVDVDEKGNLFIANENNDRIQKWMKNSNVGITVARGNGIGIDMISINPVDNKDIIAIPKK